MPVYEYEPVDHDCVMCPNRLDVIQDIGDPPLQYCPDCGLEVRKVISKAVFKTSGGELSSRAASRGFTTWKRAQEGVWEKVDGPGVDVIQGSPADVQSVQQERSKKKILDLDKES